MVMKIKSEQLRTEHYDYTMALGENEFLPIKARPEEIIIVHSVCIYNGSAVNFGAVYKLIKVKGHVCRLNHNASLNVGRVQRWATDIYLKDGDECGISINSPTAGAVACVNFQILRFRDDEYFKAT